MQDKVYAGQSLYGTKFIRDKVCTNFFHLQVEMYIVQSWMILYELMEMV
jgi:hypothetical protein